MRRTLKSACKSTRKCRVHLKGGKSKEGYIRWTDAGAMKIKSRAGGPESYLKRDQVVCIEELKGGKCLYGKLPKNRSLSTSPIKGKRAKTSRSRTNSQEGHSPQHLPNQATVFDVSQELLDHWKNFRDDLKGKTPGVYYAFGPASKINNDTPIYGPFSSDAEAMQEGNSHLHTLKKNQRIRPVRKGSGVAYRTEGAQSNRSKVEFSVGDRVKVDARLGNKAFYGNIVNIETVDAQNARMFGKPSGTVLYLIQRSPTSGAAWYTEGQFRKTQGRKPKKTTWYAMFTEGTGARRQRYYVVAPDRQTAMRWTKLWETHPSKKRVDWGTTKPRNGREIPMHSDPVNYRSRRSQEDAYQPILGFYVYGGIDKRLPSVRSYKDYKKVAKQLRNREFHVSFTGGGDAARDLFYAMADSGEMFSGDVQNYFELLEDEDLRSEIPKIAYILNSRLTDTLADAVDHAESMQLFSDRDDWQEFQEEIMERDSNGNYILSESEFNAYFDWDRYYRDASIRSEVDSFSFGGEDYVLGL